jgi:hypothetical protein
MRIEKVIEGTTELKDDGHQYPNKWAWETMFDAGDDWLKDVSFVIRNVSKKKITYLSVSCALFETNDWQVEFKKHSTPDNPGLGQASNVVGWRPKHALYSVRTGLAVQPDSDKRPPFELAPGHEFTIALQDPPGYAALKSSVEARQPMSTVTACDAQISIFFEDETRWEDHQYRRAAEQPGRWTTISFDEWSTITKAAE